MGLAHSPRIVTSGLIMALDAGNAKSYPGSGTAWSDLSGRTNTCTLVDGPTYSAGAMVFDGTANRGHVSSPSGRLSWSADTSFNQTLTFNLWVKSSDTTGYILSKPWNGSGQYNYSIQPTSFNLLAGTTSNSITFTTVSTGSWVNLVCWVDGTNMGYYINSATTGSKAHSCSGAIPSSGNLNADLCVMSLYPYGSGWAGNASFSTQGSLAVCQIYNRVLSATEVAQNYAALRGRFGI